MPKNPIPRGACDCHFHVFDGPSPQVAQRSYSTSPAPLSAYRTLQRTLGVERSVIVQPSIYGTDNRTTLQSVPDDGCMKAIVVVDDTTDSDELMALTDQGAVGLRVNMLFSSGARSTDLTALCHRMADIGWHLQVLADVSTITDLAEFVGSLPVPVVFDHMGHVPAHEGVHGSGFQSLLRLLESGTVWVKLSGAYRVTGENSTVYSDVAPMAKALIAANPDRWVWGSDWPHPAFDGPMPNDGDLLDCLFDWAGAATAEQILVGNSEQLYGFDKVETSDGS